MSTSASSTSVSQRRQHSRSLLDCGNDLTVDRLVALQSSPILSVSGSCSVKERNGGHLRRGYKWVSGLVARHNVEHQRGVSDRPRDRPVGDEPAARIRVRSVGDAAARRLDPDDAAAARRNANRASAVRSFGERTQARGDGGGRSAARTASRLAEVPRIVVGGKNPNAVVARLPNSGVLVLPSSTPPASRRRRATAASSVGT